MGNAEYMGWKFRSLPLIHDVETWFTAPSIDMTNGCNKLRPLEDTSLNDVKQCLCEEWDAVSKLENKAKEVASKEEAKKELKEATKKFQQKEEEKKKENNEEAQEKATEE